MNASKSKSRFYVYEHMTLDSGKVFYVGKGCGRRSTAKQGRNDSWWAIVKEHGYKARMVIEAIDEDLAYLVEMELIAIHRNRGVSLVNVTDGGEKFMVGIWEREDFRKRHKASAKERWANEAEREAQSKRLRAAYDDPSIKEKISRAVRKAQSDPTTKEKMIIANRLNRRSIGAREKNSQQMKRRMENPEWKEKFRQIARRKAVKVLCIETGTIFEAIGDAIRWLHSMGHCKARDAAITHVCAGRRKIAYGYRWQRIETTAVTRAAKSEVVVV